MKNRHPSGRPIRETERRGWAYGPGFGLGYRLPRLRRANGDDGEMTHAIGFAAGFTASMPDESEWLDEPWGRRK